MEILQDNVKVLNNHVLVDLGISGSHNNEFKINGTTLFVDTTWNPSDYVKRSAIVLDAPSKLHEYKGVKVRYMMKNPLAREGDLVFIEPEAHDYCKNNGFLFKREDGSTAMTIRYDHLICTVTDDKIQMHNGKLIVKLRNDLSQRNSSVLYIPEHLRRDNYTWVEVLYADNNEGFESINVLSKKRFVGLTEKYNVGDILLINRFSDFNLQGIVQEYDFDETQKVVRRENVVARMTSDDNIEAMGFYGVVKAEDISHVTKGGIIIPDSKKLRPVYGTVESVGSAFCGVSKGQNIRFKDKDCITYKEKHFVHIEWVLLTY